MFGFAPDNPDINCPDCHTLMVDMSKYADALNEGVGFGADSPLYLRGAGRRGGLNPFGFAELIGSLVDGILDIGKNSKAKRLCRDTLPDYPKSQICPKCLYVFRRK